jgi:hypothetical protein
MKSLPNVTLISYDNSDDPTRTLKALQHCAKLIAFADVILCCSVFPMAKGDDHVCAIHVPATGYRGAMEWEVFGLNDYVGTDYALCIHHDGYIVNPDTWRDYWLDYDFIGAPWPGLPHPSHPGKSESPHRVGNTGCCLKSKAFMRETAALRSTFLKSYRTDKYGQTLGGDTFCCQHQRPYLESRGIKFAPVEVAADFAWESNIEEYPNGRPDAFGFHNFSLENKKVPHV